MGLASSSAVRVDEAYGSLGGAFGGMGAARKLKKMPVLVLDPDELAKAHQLFQIGAAEQLVEFDPQARASRPATPLFGTILGEVANPDEDDDYIAPLDLVEEEEEPEEELPPIDLDALLALSPAEQEEEDAFYREAAEEELAFEADTFAAEEPDHEPAREPAIPEAAAPSEALARIISRAAAQPKPIGDDRHEFAPIAEQTFLPEAVAEPDKREPEPELQAEFVAEEPECHTPELADIAGEDGVPEPEPLDLQPEEEIDSEAFVYTEAPLRTFPIMGEEGTRSQLRARLVREDIPLEQPEPSPWRNWMNALRDWWQNL